MSTTRAADGTPLRSESVADTRLRILVAARECVARDGLGRTSMVDVARRAGVGRTTVYRHWTDLPTLLAELLDSEFVDLVGDLPADHGSLDEVVDVIVTVCERARDSELLTAVSEREPELLGRYLVTRLGRSQHRLLDLLTALVRCAAEHEPGLRERDPRECAALLLVSLQGAVVSTRLVSPWLGADAWRRELRHLVKGHLAP